MKELLLNNMVKFTSFVNYNNKFEQKNDNYAFERINNENNYEMILMMLMRILMMLMRIMAKNEICNKS